MKPKFLDEPMPQNPWTPHAKANMFNFGIVWKEFKWSMSHPKDTFKQAVFGFYGKNPQLEPEWRLMAFVMVILGLMYFGLGLAAIIVSLV